MAGMVSSVWGRDFKPAWFGSTIVVDLPNLNACCLQSRHCQIQNGLQSSAINSLPIEK
jgi:hypothetical protein